MKRSRSVERLEWALACMLVHSASLAVPRRRREEWRGEWFGELWQVRSAAGRGSAGLCAALRFACGAFVDARWMRREFQDECMEVMTAPGCLLLLLAISFTGVLAAICSPTVRAEYQQICWRTSPDWALLFPPGSGDESTATVLPVQYRLWAGHAQYFTSFDYYQTVHAPVFISGRSTTLDIALATPGLKAAFDGVPVLPVCAKRSMPELFVTPVVWRDVFHADANTLCNQAIVNGRVVLLSGVLPLHNSGLPGGYQAWVFQVADDTSFHEGVPGFVVARLPEGMVTNPYFGYGHAAITESSRTEASLLLFRVADRKLSPWALLGLGFGLSLLALPATTPLGFGEYVRRQERSPLQFAVRRWLFMLVKLALCVAISATAALLLSTWSFRTDWRLAAEVQIFAMFVLSLLSQRWAIRDQRRRCPICLKPLTHPARVGEVSKNFLSWNGTELVCESGHGLLHVPAHATSWFGTQRWLTLDPSWHFLFAPKR